MDKRPSQIKLASCRKVSASFNFNSAANVDDDSCIPFIEGCTDAAFVEFNGLANTDDGTCLNIIVLGCTIDYALNYNQLANTNDGILLMVLMGLILALLL